MKKVKYIFSINTGRSGSGYLYKLLSCSPEIEAYHEGLPKMNGKWMRQYLRYGQAESSLVEKKLQAMRSSDKIYAESSHLFIKGFGWEVLENIPNDEVLIICLNREKRLILKSFIDLKTDFFADAINWYISPLSRFQGVSSLYSIRDIVLILFFRPIRVFLSFIHIRYSYKFVQGINRRWISKHLRGTEILMEALKKKFPKCNYFDIELSELNNIDRVEEMFHMIGVSYNKESLNRLIGTKYNRKEKAKDEKRKKSCSRPKNSK